MKRKNFSIRVTRDKKGMGGGSTCDGEVTMKPNLIWITLDSAVTDKIEILIHEFTHFNLLNMFDNGCKPYWQRVRNEETSDKQKAIMVKYNKLVAPKDIGWYGIGIPETNFVSKTMPNGPNHGFAGVRKGFMACDKADGPGMEEYAQNILLLETIPHVVEMIFVLTDVNLNYEKIFDQVQDIKDATTFFVNMLLKDLRQRDREGKGEYENDEWWNEKW